MALDDFHYESKIVQVFMAMGENTCLDDFGTDYSSFTYLR
jgi:EAL domain-containing protein (putative c-di-GMP-specific phosphodiesterase class I)